MFDAGNENCPKTPSPVNRDFCPVRSKTSEYSYLPDNPLGEPVPRRVRNEAQFPMLEHCCFLSLLTLFKPNLLDFDLGKNARWDLVKRNAEEFFVLVSSSVC